MNTVTLLQLHEKAIKTLECIDKAKYRLEGANEMVKHFNETKPSWADNVLPFYYKRIEANKAVITRLKLYYYTTLRLRIEEAQERAFKNQ